MNSDRIKSLANIVASNLSEAANRTKRNPTRDFLRRYPVSDAEIVKRVKKSEKKKEEKQSVAEAGPFSYGAKPPRKGSVAYNALMKRKEQDRNRVKEIEAIGTKNHHVGVAKVTKEQIEDVTETYKYIDQSGGHQIKGKSGTFVGYTHSATKGKGANILKHNKTGQYYAAGGSSTAFTQKTTLHDTPEAAAKAYHKGNLAEEEFNNEAYMGNVKPKKSAHQKFKDSMKRAGYDMDAGAKRLQDLLDRQKKEREDREMNSTKSEEASPMIKPPKNEFGKKEDAFAHAKKHGGKVMKKTFTHPTSGMQTVSYVVKEDAELAEAIKLNSKVKIHAPGKDYHGKVGHVGEIRKGLHNKAPKTYTVDYDYDTKTGNKKSIQLDKSKLKIHNEETEIDEAYMGKVKLASNPREKWMKSVKDRGYDMRAGAQRLQDLLDKQKKERAEMEQRAKEKGLEY